MQGAKVRLIVWNEAEARERSARLERHGYVVDWQLRSGPELVAELKTTDAGALVIDLGRAPAQGRDVAVYARRSKKTRHLPIVFVGGEPARRDAARAVLPDAAFTTWEEIDGALKAALAAAPSTPVVPTSVFAAYADRPLTAKLGLKPSTVLALLAAPAGFLETLGPLPEGVTVVTRMGRDVNLAIWFVGSRHELDARIEAVAARAGASPLWIAWPKKVAGSAADLTQMDVRRAGLASGLVDYKICSIDATWSALLFRKRGA